MNKVVYLITTQECSACKCMKYILSDVQQEIPNFTLTIVDYTETPDFIKDNINLTDFPTTVFVEDDTIKYHFTGTLNEKGIKKIIKEIGFEN